MKKMVFSFIAVLAMAIALVSWKNAKSANDGAVVINDGGCSLFDGSGDIVYYGIGNAVVAPSGNSSVTCQANVPNSSGKAVIYTDFLCQGPTGIGMGRETVSASGQATLTCYLY